MGVPIVEKTRKTGQVETGKDVLMKYAPAYPACAAIVKLREWVALEQNYLSKLQKALDYFPTPLLRFPFNTMGAPTGRMSAGGEKGAYAKGLVDVNIQSMPEWLRSCFVANDPRQDTDDWVIVKIDFSQIELRIAGNLSEEPTWIQAYQRGDDLHMVNTRMAYHNPTLQRGTPEGEAARDFGKTMGFALLYGATASTIAGHGRIPTKDAERLVENFFAGATSLKDWIGRTQAQARQQGYIDTYFGRRRDLTEFFCPDASKSVQARGYREAINDPIQGAAADYFKMAVNWVERHLQTHHLLEVWCPFFWIHDELVSRVRRDCYQDLLPGILAAMTLPVRGWHIPMVPEATVGWDWLTLGNPAHPLPPKPQPSARPAAPVVPVTLHTVLSATPI
jgi:DNA polymerase-1